MTPCFSESAPRVTTYSSGVRRHSPQTRTIVFPPNALSKDPSISPPDRRELRSSKARVRPSPPAPAFNSLRPAARRRNNFRCPRFRGPTSTVIVHRIRRPSLSDVRTCFFSERQDASLPAPSTYPGTAVPRTCSRRSRHSMEPELPTLFLDTRSQLCASVSSTSMRSAHTHMVTRFFRPDSYSSILAAQGPGDLDTSSLSLVHPFHHASKTPDTT